MCKNSDTTKEENIKKPYWQCQECGYEDPIRPMPDDREKFYAKVSIQGSPKCPWCKSIGFMPVGY